MSIRQAMQTPFSIDIAITGRCNLDCKYCFYADEMVALSDLPTDRWLAFFDELGALGVVNVVLTGGEVFTRKDLFELIDRLIANKMRYALLSNGTLITEKTVEKFNVGKRRTRLDYIQISIDGSTAEIHNLSRPRSFDRAVRGLRLLVAHDLKPAVRVTINRHNVDDLENIARLLLEDVGLSMFSCNEASPMGAAHGDEADIVLTHAQRVQAMEILADLNQRYPGQIVAQAGPLALADYFQRIDDAIARGETGFPGAGHLTGCGCPSNKLSILHDGSIVPCHQLSELRMGKIGEVSLQDVWLNHDIENAMRDRRAIPLSELDTCADCPYQGFCRGGCPGNTFVLTGELNARSIMSCYRIFKGEDPFISPDMATKVVPGSKRAEREKLALNVVPATQEND